MKTKEFVGAVVASAALANWLLLSSLPPEIRLVGALVLFVVLPGYLLVQAVFCGPRPGGIERWLLALGCGYVLALGLAAVLYLFFRPIHTAHLLVGADFLNGLLLLSALARQSKGSAGDKASRRSSLQDLRDLRRPGWPAVAALAVVVVAAAFRLVNLDHSDFQGDEVKVLLRALAVLQGAPDALIAHRKPPGEILLSATFSGGLGIITELTARLPFALAGVAAVVACYHLGRAMFGPRTGLVAGLLLAVNGYFVAFGRILQYPSVSLLLDLLAILCLFRFAREPTAQRSYAIVGGLLLAGSGLMALSAVFLLPVAAVALWPSLFGPQRVQRRDLAVWLWPLVLLAPGLVLVYGLLAREEGGGLDPTIIPRYLGHRLAQDQPYFNLSAFLVSANHYTSSLYLLVVLGAGALVLLAPLHQPFGRLVELLGRASSRRQIGSVWLAVDPPRLSAALLLLAIIGLLLSSARRSLSWKLALVWLAGPLFTHLFLVGKVGTHWREIFPGLLLLVAAAAVGLYARLADKPTRLALLFAGALFLAASGHYVYVAWIQPWPEYQLLYPRYRHPLDWTDLDGGDLDRRVGGLFGLTRRHGWKAVGELMAQGQLPADYDTNDYPNRVLWYTKRLPVCPEAAKLLVRAPINPTARRAIENGETLPGYVLAGQVYEGGRPTLALLVREPPTQQPRVYEATDYGWRFDRELASPWEPVGDLYRPTPNSATACR